MNKKFEKLAHSVNKAAQRILPLFIVLGGGTTFAACGVDSGNETPPNSDPPPVINPVDPEPTPTPDPVIPTADYDQFVAKLEQSRNYTYIVDDKKGLATYEIDGNKVCLEDFSIDVNRVYLLNEGDYTYRFVYNAMEEKFFKTRDEVKTNFDAYILNRLKLAEITAYDKDKELYSVTIDGKNYTAKLDTESLVLDDGKVKYYIEDVNATSFTLPCGDIVVDKTEEEQEPEKPEPGEPVVKDSVYTVDAQGARVYDKAVLTRTVVEALNTERPTGETLYSSITSNVGKSVDEVLFVSTSGENIRVGALCTSVADKKTVDIFDIFNSKTENISADKQDWIDSLLLNNIYTNEIIFRSFAQLINTECFNEEHQGVLQKTYKAVMNKFAECGEQTNSYNILGTPVPRFENASAVGYVFEAKDDADGLVGFGLGITRRTQLFALTVDKNGEYVFVNINVASTSFRDNIYDTILGGGINDKFIVYRVNDLIDVETVN